MSKYQSSTLFLTADHLFKVLKDPAPRNGLAFDLSIKEIPLKCSENVSHYQVFQSPPVNFSAPNLFDTFDNK